MITVWKFVLPVADDFTIEMPKNARLLSVAAQKGVATYQPGVQVESEEACLWAAVDTERKVRGGCENMTIIRKTVEVELDNILSLVHCAEVYGFDRSVFYDGMADFIGRKCSNKEIEAYVKSFADDPAYGEEDYDEAVRVLTEWRDRYCKGTKK